MKNFFSGAKNAIKGITLSGILDALDSFLDILFLYGGFVIIALTLLFDYPASVGILGAFWVLIALFGRQMKLRREIGTLRSLVGHITVVLATSEILIGLRKDAENVTKITGKN